MDGMLSQEEINALLGGMDSGNDNSNEEILTSEEKDAVGEISNICMGTAATTLYSLVNNKVTITTPNVSYCTWDELIADYDKPCVFIYITYKEGIKGNNILILKEDDVKIITDLMMGGDGTDTSNELSELHLSAIGEAMNQMMGSAATSLSSMMNRKIDISPPKADIVDFNGEADPALSGFMESTFVKVSFKMEIGDLVNSEIMQLYTVDFSKDIYKVFTGQGSDSSKEEAPKPESKIEVNINKPSESASPQPEMQNQSPLVQNQMQGGQQMPPMQGQMPYGYGMPPMQGQMPYGYGVPPMQDVNAQAVQFTPFAGGINPITQQENIDLIMDVPLEVTVELGRTKKSIKEILEFAPGTIVELDKIAGEPIDVLVNGKLVAKGEVVVIEESFGIRVTEIIKK